MSEPIHSTDIIEAKVDNINLIGLLLLQIKEVTDIIKTVLEGIFLT